MPWGDGTGPAGLGPRTGRGLGFCAGFNSPGYMHGPGWGRGWGRGPGRGFGWRWFWRNAYPPRPITPEEEKNYLKARLSAIEEEAKYIREQLGAEQS